MQDDLKSQNPQSGAVPLPLYRLEFHTRLRVPDKMQVLDFEHLYFLLRTFRSTEWAIITSLSELSVNPVI